MYTLPFINSLTVFLNTKNAIAVKNMLSSNMSNDESCIQFSFLVCLDDEVETSPVVVVDTDLVAYVTC